MSTAIYISKNFTQVKIPTAVSSETKSGTISLWLYLTKTLGEFLSFVCAELYKIYMFSFLIKETSLYLWEHFSLEGILRCHFSGLFLINNLWISNHCDGACCCIYLYVKSSGKVQQFWLQHQQGDWIINHYGNKLLKKWAGLGGYWNCSEYLSLFLEAR